MQHGERIRGERSILSPSYGRYRRDTVQPTESVRILDELKEVLAEGSRVERRTEKVYGLWWLAQRRQTIKASEIVEASDVIGEAAERENLRSRRIALVATAAALVAVFALAILVPWGAIN